MIDRISGVERMWPPGRADLRVRLMRESLHRNSEVSFRYRGARQTGRVLELLPRAVVVEFRVGGASRAEAVRYNSILRVLSP